MVKRMTVHFSGTVQGVGFRFTAERVARGFSVAGYVRNLPDGRVQLLAEAEEEELKNFLKAICKSYMSHYIRDVQTAWSEPENEFQHFSIRS